MRAERRLGTDALVDEHGEQEPDYQRPKQVQDAEDEDVLDRD